MFVGLSWSFFIFKLTLKELAEKSYLTFNLNFFLTFVLLMSSSSGADDRRPCTILSKQTTNVKKKKVKIKSWIPYALDYKTRFFYFSSRHFRGSYNRILVGGPYIREGLVFWLIFSKGGSCIFVLHKIPKTQVILFFGSIICGQLLRWSILYLRIQMKTKLNVNDFVNIYGVLY